MTREPRFTGEIHSGTVFQRRNQAPGIQEVYIWQVRQGQVHFSALEDWDLRPTLTLTLRAFRERFVPQR